MAGPTSFDASAIISGVISIDRLPPGLGVPFVSVLDHGAKGDGETDDTAAIQAAIEAAEGKLLFVPKGEYILSQNESTGYCLRIMQPVSILMEPGAVLKLARSVPNSANAIQIGDGSTAVSGVSIEGGVVDGDAVANGGTYSVAKAAIYIDGPVSQVSLRRLSIRNCLASGLVVDGQSSTSRAKHIAVEDCEITEVAEGVRFQKCDELHMRGGSITKMLSQDGFEPHGAVSGWSLRDCYLDDPHPSNSAIEVFPQHGHIERGVIDNCTIVNDELRISLQSGVAGNEVRDMTVSNCYFKNSNVYAGVSGEFRNVTIEKSRFEGPGNIPRNTSKPFCGILSHGASNTIAIRDNKISGYQSHGISVAGHDCLITGNEVFNNGQDATLATSQRFGILTFGNRVKVTDNMIYDNQTTPTQQAGLSYAGNDGSYLGNKMWGNVVAVNNAGKNPMRSLGVANLGHVDTVQTVATIAAGKTSIVIDTAALGFASNSGLHQRALAQPFGDIAPATRYWFTRSGGFIRLNIDAAPAASQSFFVMFFAPGLRF